MKTYLLILFVSFLMIGCSGKKYYEPKESKSGMPKISLEASIKSFNKNIATLENQKFVVADKIIDSNLSKNLDVLNFNANTIIATDKNNTIYLKEKNVTKKFNLEQPIVAASYKNGVIATIFSDNSLGIFDTKQEKFTFKEYLNPPLACDNRIANPIFLTDIALFPTLDGKVVVVALERNEKVRDILVHPEGQFNNIIFLETVGDILVAATRNKIVTLGTGNFISKDLEIVDVIVKDETIYVATLDGQIIAFNTKLESLKSKKYKYAKIVGLSATKDFIYILESQGYLIQLAKDFSKEEIFSLSIGSGDKIFSNESTIIIGDTKLLLK